MIDVVIVGAGIGGLTLAYRLEQSGLSVRIIEASGEAGGAIKTKIHDGYLIELGPNSTLSKEEFNDLVEDLHLGEQLVTPQEHAQSRYLATRRLAGSTPQIAAAPSGPLQALRTPLLSTKAKLWVFREPFVTKTSAEDESVASFITRRLGQELCNEIVAPVLSGIWAANLETLSCRSALPFLWETEQEHGSVIRGAFKELKKRKKNRPKKKSKRQRKLASFREGMKTLPASLVQALAPESLMLNTKVERLEINGQGVRLFCSSSNGKENTSLEARLAVISTAADTAASLVSDIEPQLSSALDTIPYSPLGLIHFAYQKEFVEHPLDGFGFLVPPTLGFALLGAIFSSSLFPGRAPEGSHLLSCFVGGGTNPELFDVHNPQIQERVIRELNTMIKSNHRPTIIAETTWPRSIPNYPLGHFRIRQAVRDFETRFESVKFLASWDKGISVSDRIAEASALARTISQRDFNSLSRKAEN